MYLLERGRATRWLRIGIAAAIGVTGVSLLGGATHAGSPLMRGAPYMPGTPLPIPASATVLTLSGLNCGLYNDMPEKFQGVFAAPPYEMVKVDYPACFIPSDSIDIGVANLNAALLATPGEKIVLAQSQGAQVASRWMRQNATDPNAPGAGELTFILTGNPLRSTGGYIIGRTEIGGATGVPTPTDTPWPIIDVARRYDGWADWVHDDSNDLAVANAEEGKDSLHTAYDEVDITDPTHTIWTSGNTSYVLTAEQLPLTGLSEYDDLPGNVYSQLAAHVESAYDRPPNDPPVEPLPVTDPAWRDQLHRWGVPIHDPNPDPIVTSSSLTLDVDPGGQAFYRSSAGQPWTLFTTQNWQTQLNNSATTPASCLGDGGPSGADRDRSPRSSVSVVGPTGVVVLAATSPYRDPLTGAPVTPNPGPYAYMGGGWQAPVDLTGQPAGTYTVTTTSVDRYRSGTLLVSCAEFVERIVVIEFEFQPSDA